MHDMRMLLVVQKIARSNNRTRCSHFRPARPGRRLRVVRGCRCPLQLRPGRSIVGLSARPCPSLRPSCTRARHFHRQRRRFQHRRCVKCQFRANDLCLDDSLAPAISLTSRLFLLVSIQGLARLREEILTVALFHRVASTPFSPCPPGWPFSPIPPCPPFPPWQSMNKSWAGETVHCSPD